MTEIEKEEIEQELFIQDYPQKADIAIVFGSSDPEKLKARVYRSVDLFHNGFTDKVLFTGGYSSYSQPEGEIMAKIANDFELPTQSILIENKSRNTMENLLFSKVLLEEKGLIKNIQRIILVSSIWHMARIVFLAKRKFSSELQYTCCPETMTTPLYDWHLDKEIQQKILNERILFRTLTGKFI